MTQNIQFKIQGESIGQVCIAVANVKREVLWLTSQ